MAYAPPLSSDRRFQILVAAAITAAQVVLWLLAFAPARMPEPQAEPRPQGFLVEPLPLSPSRPAQTSPASHRRRKREAAASSPFASGPGPMSVPAARGATGVVSGGDGRGAQAGQKVWGVDIPDPFAMREALREAAGCGIDGFKLRSDEQERCDKRHDKWRKRGRTLGPAADDPKRAAELANEEEDNRRRAKWKSGYGEPGMVSLPPRPVEHETSALDDPNPQ